MIIRDRITQREKQQLEKIKKNKRENLSERQLRELMGEFDQRLERRRGAFRRR